MLLRDWNLLIFGFFGMVFLIEKILWIFLEFWSSRCCLILFSIRFVLSGILNMIEVRRVLFVLKSLF